MPIRMSGMISGMDTEAMIKELMSAHSMKKTRIEQKKTKLDWKQEKWAELNTKIYKLYTDQISKLRLAGNYATKKATSSNEDMVTATAGTGAGSGSHTISVESLASAQYVTGKKVDLKESSKLMDAGMAKGTIIKISSGAGSTPQTLEVTENTTIRDFVSAMKNAGLNASFDEGQGRFFISGKNSGAANTFSIQTYTMANSTASSNLVTATGTLKSAANLSDAQISSYRSLVEDFQKKEAAYATATDKVSALAELQAAQKKVTDMEESFYEQAAKAQVIEGRKTALTNGKDSTDPDIKKAYDDIVAGVDKGFYELDDDGNVKDPKVLSKDILDKVEAAYRDEATKTINDKINAGEVKYATPEEKQAAIDAEKDRLLAENGGKATDLATNVKAKEFYDNAMNNAITSAANSYAATDEGKEAIKTAKDTLKADVTTDGTIGKELADYKDAVSKYNTAVSDAVNDDANKTTGQLANIGLTDIDGANIVDNDGNKDGKVSIDGVQISMAADSKITLDGAVLEGDTNSFTVAGVTYNLKNMTAGSSATITVTNDTQAVFDMVKDFVKNYNELMTEMNTLYGAPSAKGYEPLTDEEKEAMSDKQVELWENKIKDSLLRRDDTLGGVINAMRTSLQTSVTVNGTKYSLASFGIVTGEYTEKGLLHLQGNPDDGPYADKANKLMDMLAKNPEEAAEALSGIMKNLYGTMQDKMKGSSVSSALTFYNDKEMKKQIGNYEKDIAKWEDRLLDMEDRYYKQFSAMETALAKLQSQSNYLSGMMGGN